MVLILAATLGVFAPAPPVDVPPPAAFTLDWSAPLSCPSGAAVEALVAELVEGKVDGEGTMAVTGRVTEGAEGFHLVLTTVVGTRTTSRELDATACTELTRSVALVVAITMVPMLAEAQPEAHDKPSSDPDPAGRPDPVLEPPPGAEPVPADEFAAAAWRGPPAAAEPSTEPSTEPGLAPLDESPVSRGPKPWLRVGLGVDTGGTPGPTLASRLSVGVSWGHVRLAVDGTHLAPRRAHGFGNVSGLVQQGTVGLTACGVPTASHWAFPLCAGTEVGLMRADSRGVEPSVTATGLVATPLLRGGTVRSWGRWGLWLDGELLVRAATTSVVLDGAEIFRPNPVWFRAVAGVEVFLGRERGSAGQGD